MGRRGNGEGNIYRRKDGLYEARFFVETESGVKKRKSVYAKTRKEVADKLTEALANHYKGIVLDDKNLTVGKFVTRWLEDSAKGDLAHRTYSNYRLQVRRHILPAIGEVKLAKLTPAHVQHLYAQKLRDGLAPGSVRYIHAVLHRALKQAVRWGMIPRNPAAAVDLPKIRQEEIRPLDPHQSHVFLEEAGGDKFEALYVLSLTTGLRMGEALALKWSDIDFEEGTLRVNRQVQRVRREDGKPGRLVFSEPKNASRRTIALPQRALESLRSHRKRQLEVQAKGRLCVGR